MMRFALFCLALILITSAEGQIEKTFSFYFPEVLEDCYACSNFPNVGLPPWNKHVAREGAVLASVQMPNSTDRERVSQAYCCRYTFGQNAQIDLTDIVRVEVQIARQAFYEFNTIGAYDNWLWFGIYDKTDQEMIFGQWHRNQSQIGTAKIPTINELESKRAFNYSIPNWQDMGSVVLGYQIIAEEANSYVELVNGTITVTYTTSEIVLSDETIILIGVLVGVGVPVAGTALFLGIFFGIKQKKNKKEKQELKRELEKQKGNYTEMPDILPVPNKETPYLAIGPNPEENSDPHPLMGKPVQSPQGDLNSRFNIPFKHLKFKREIGMGGFGKVFVGEWQSTEVAIKVSNAITSFEEFQKEAELMINIRPHPNVLQVLGVSTDGFAPAIIMDFCAGGSLDAVLFKQSNEFSAQSQFKLIMGIARGLLHLHKNNIVHRDLAARNVLLTGDGEPKISDFGMSRIIEAASKEGTTKTTVGPVKWMSPEAIRDRVYSTKSDVWSFGIVLSEIVNRSEPHAEFKNVIDVALQIRDFNKTPALVESAPDYIKQITEKCWASDPEDRPEMEEICELLNKHKKEHGL